MIEEQWTFLRKRKSLKIRTQGEREEREQPKIFTTQAVGQAKRGERETTASQAAKKVLLISPNFKLFTRNALSIRQCCWHSSAAAWLAPSSAERDAASSWKFALFYIFSICFSAFFCCFFFSAWIAYDDNMSGHRTRGTTIIKPFGVGPSTVRERGDYRN